MDWILQNTELLLYTCAGLVLLLFYIRQKKRIRTFLTGAVTGLSALTLLHFFGGYIGYTPTMCLFNITVSVILGIPGVALLYIAEMFLT